MTFFNNILMSPIIFAAVIAFVLLVWIVKIFNGLVSLRNHYLNAFSQIDVQLKRRYDLIPNLVETAKGYMKHERETLEAVIAARNQAAGVRQGAANDPSNTQKMMELQKADGALGASLSRLMVVAEAYPDLKANTNMKAIMEELSSTENKISFSRQAYNDSVTSFNTEREMFPTNFFAGMFGFHKASLWEIDNVAHRENVKVAF
jgi:LemA protein